MNNLGDDEMDLLLSPFFPESPRDNTLQSQPIIHHDERSSLTESSNSAIQMINQNVYHIESLKHFLITNVSQLSREAYDPLDLVNLFAKSIQQFYKIGVRVELDRSNRSLVSVKWAKPKNSRTICLSNIMQIITLNFPVIKVSTITSLRNVEQLYELESSINLGNSKSIVDLYKGLLYKQLRSLGEKVTEPTNAQDFICFAEFHHLIHNKIFGDNSLGEHEKSFVISTTASVFRKYYCCTFFMTNGTWNDIKIDQFAQNIKLLYDY